MDISVVIPSYNSAGTIAKNIESIKACSPPSPKEIIVVDSGTDDTGEIINKRFPEVIFIHSAKRLFPGGARNIGWRKASAGIIAFVDSDCLVDTDWLINIKEAHENSSVAAVTGSFEMANPENPYGFVVFCAELAGSLPGHPPGPTRLTPSGNTSYKRYALEKTGGFLEDVFCEDTILARKLIEKGEGIWFEPAIKVRHINREGYSAFKAAFQRSGYYSGIARKMFKLKGHKFATKAFLIPLLIPYRCLNVYLVNYKGQNPAMKRLIKLFPLVCWAMILWAIGFRQGVKAAGKQFT